MTARVRLPASIKRGEIVEVRTLVTHVMETGHRTGDDGKPVPRRILNSFVARFQGKDVVRMALAPAIAANPYIAFHFRATASGPLEMEWTDDDGSSVRHVENVTVS
jgi:sulfur-oxidizing protein SoxZ